MAIGPDDVAHIAALARLEVPPAELPRVVAELSDILTHLETLSSVSVDGVEPMSTLREVGGPLRADEVGADQLTRAVSDAAPAWRDGYFLVPRLAAHEDA